MSSIKKFAGQTAIYGFSTVISRILNFLLTPIYTRIYSTKVYGIFTTMFSYASILNALLAFGMETTFFRFLSKYENDKQRVYSSAFTVILSIAVVFFFFTIFFVDDIARWMQEGSPYDIANQMRYVKYFIFILIADALAVIPFAKVRADGRPARFGIIKFTNILTFIGFNLIFIYVIPYFIKHQISGYQSLQAWFRPQWVGYVFISNLIASVVTLLMLLPEMLQIRFKTDKKILEDMLSYSWPVLVANLSFIVNENMDKIFLGRLLPAKISNQEVGIYGACCKIAIFLSIFIQAFRLGAEPFFFSHAKNKNSGKTYATIMDYFVIAISLIFVGVVANIEILKHFVGEEYWSGLRVVPILLFGYVSLGIYMNLSVWYKLSDQTRFGLYISGAGAIVTIILNVIFIPEYSYMASAWTSLIAYTTMMVLSYVLGQRNYPIPYNIKKNLAYISASVIAVIICFTVFDRNIISGNIILIIFAATAFFAERKELQKILMG